MVQKYYDGMYLLDGRRLVTAAAGEAQGIDRAGAAKGTMAYRILAAHDRSEEEGRLALRFDALAAHDMTYIGVLQTAIACGIESFSLPFVMTDCHNSLCAMAGTFNEDDHLFSLSAAKRFGGIRVPVHQAIIHQYMRETQAGCGKMILGADSHTRYGALGTMAIGEGAGELVKQLVGRTYDIDRPKVVLVYFTGSVQPGVGPQDVALALIGNVFKDGFVKNCVLEFCGPGIASMSTDYRNGIDVMTTESSCLSTIWETDAEVESFLAAHGRVSDYRELHPEPVAFYDRAVCINLDKVTPMIAMPFHPSNVYPIDAFRKDAADILHEVEQNCNQQMSSFGLRLDLMSKLENGRLRVDQGVIAGCAGGLFTNLCAAADILHGRDIGNGGFALHIYPASQPILTEIIRNGAATDILKSGADLRSAFCGPCFGAGDIPGQMGFSIRHTTRNFANRDGSRPKQGQVSAVALMDARSIAATAVNGGLLTAATELEEVAYQRRIYSFDRSIYEKRCLNRYGKADPDEPLVMGVNIRPIPVLPKFREHLLLRVASYLPDPVTTTDELIPGGESTSYRSNLLRLADYALSTRDPDYVPRSKAIREAIGAFDETGACKTLPSLEKILAVIRDHAIVQDISPAAVTLGSVLVSQKPGDGSAREYAATCQRMLGGAANICREYATKRYRSNLINWGMFPFTIEDPTLLAVDDYVFVPHLRQAIQEERESVVAYRINESGTEAISLMITPLLPEEREILLAGCLINYYRGE